MFGQSKNYAELCTVKLKQSLTKKNKQTMEKILRVLRENGGRYIFDDDIDIFLYDGDTEEELGECFRVIGLGQEGDNVFVHMDCEDDAWNINDLTDYEIGLIEEEL